MITKEDLEQGYASTFDEVIKIMKERVEDKIANGDSIKRMLKETRDTERDKKHTAN